MIEYYVQQSEITDPLEWSYLFDELPKEMPLIKTIIHGLLFHFWDGPSVGYQIPIKRLQEVHTRYVSKMLELIIARDSRALTFSRSLENKMIGSCRDFAILFCAILRYHGIPSRVRAAFNLYFLNDFYHDQVILEYWNSKKKKFCRVDPRSISANLDLFDVQKDKLMLAGEAWLLARKAPEIADKFGGGNREKNKGLWYIRDRLIQDLAALNRVEMQLWDVFGKMRMPEESLADKKVLNYFDELAKLTLNPEENLEALKYFFEKDLPEIR